MDEKKPGIKLVNEFGVVIAIFQDQSIVDDLTIHGLEADLLALVMSSPAELKLVLDFRKVESLSSCMLGVLLRLSKRIEERNGHMKFCCLQKRLFEVFKLTRLDQIFEFYDRREDAVDDF